MEQETKRKEAIREALAHKDWCYDIGFFDSKVLYSLKNIFMPLAKQVYSFCNPLFKDSLEGQPYQGTQVHAKCHMRGI